MTPVIQLTDLPNFSHIEYNSNLSFLFILGSWELRQWEPSYLLALLMWLVPCNTCECFVPFFYQRQVRSSDLVHATLTQDVMGITLTKLELQSQRN